MNETVFKHSEKNWKPRNLQAALIVRRANPLLLHTHPPEPPKKAPTLKERLADESRIRVARIKRIEEQARERRERRAQNRGVPKQKPKWKHMWVAKYLKRLHKSRGLPPPTIDQIRTMRSAQPNYGKSL